MVQSIFFTTAGSHVDGDKSHGLTFESITPTQVKAILQDACERARGQFRQQLRNLISVLCHSSIETLHQ